VARFTTWPSRAEPARGRQRDLEWEELEARVRDPSRGAGVGKAKLPQWSFASFRDDYRSGEHFQEAHALAIDYDSHRELPSGDPKRGNPELDLAAITGCWGGWRRVVHTTASHRPGGARWRVFLFLSRPVSADEYRRLARWILRYGQANGAPGLEADDSWHQPAQGWYMPARHPHYEGECCEGELLDVDARLAEIDAAEELEQAEPEEGDDGTLADVAGWSWLVPDASWLEEEPPPPKYLLHEAGPEPRILGPGLLPRGKVGILAGAGGVGKTLALCGLALSVAMGLPWLGRFPVGPGGTGRAVLVLGEEDPAELRRRLFCQAQAKGIDQSHFEAISRILALPGAGRHDLALTQPESQGQGVETGAARALRIHLEEQAEQNGEGWDLVILDPLARFAGPDVETDNSAATRLIQVAERFTTLPGAPTVVLAHHVAKYARIGGAPQVAAAGVRGSSALVDGARWVANLVPVIREDGTWLAKHVRLLVSKSNYAAFPREQPLYLTRVAGGGLRVATVEELRRIEEESAAGRSPSRGPGPAPPSPAWPADA